VEEPVFDLPASIPATFEERRPVERPRRRGARAFWQAALVVAMIALGAIGYQAYEMWQPARSAAPVAAVSDAPPLALQVERHDADLRISWNRGSRSVTQATDAVLSIRDGETQQQELHLDLDQLRNGSVLYTPANRAVRFRLEVTTPGEGKISETVLALTAARPEAQAAEPQAQPASPGPSPQPDAAAASSASKDAAGKFGEPLRVVMVDAPKGQPRTSALLDAPQPPPAPKQEPAASSDPAPLYLPAKPTRQVQPVLSAAVRNLIAAPVEVAVKVTISATGKVEQAEAQPTRELVSSTLIAAARTAALRWRFAPAIRGTKSVPSELVLKFQFRPAR
jgi:hypothetical protein